MIHLTEKQYRDYLLTIYPGKTEVNTESGRIDILTEHELIEVKFLQQWKNAIGQLVSYGSYYPTHQKILVTFGNAFIDKKTIKQVCNTNNIKYLHLDVIFDIVLDDVSDNIEIYKKEVLHLNLELVNSHIEKYKITELKLLDLFKDLFNTTPNMSDKHTLGKILKQLGFKKNTKTSVWKKTDSNFNYEN